MDFGAVVEMSDRAVIDTNLAPSRGLRRVRLGTIIISIVSAIVFEALYVFQAYCVIYEQIPLIPMLILMLLCLLCGLAVAAIIKFLNDDVVGFLSFGISLVVCVLIVLRPHIAAYEADLARFVIGRGYYIADVQKSGSALKVYTWFPGGGFSGAFFVDLVFDPRGTGDWAHELKNLQAARPESVPGYLMDESCKHELKTMPDRFYVVTTVC